MLWLLAQLLRVEFVKAVEASASTALTFLRATLIGRWVGSLRRALRERLSNRLAFIMLSLYAALLLGYMRFLKLLIKQ